jgi:hypothetical protein
VQPAIDDVGPVLLFLVLIAQAIHLVAQGRGTRLFATLVTVAVLVNGAELLVEIPLRLAQAGSALIMWLAFLPIGRELLRRSSSDLTPAVTMTWRTLAGWSLILAPVGQLGGWIFMRFGGNEGVEPWSTIAHSVWLIGFVLLAIACVELYRRVRSRGAGQILARVSLAVALISVTASIAEMLVDLYALFATDNHAQLKAMDQLIRSIPGAEPILYGFGTQLVYLGFLALIVQLAILRRISRTTLTLVLATLILFICYEVLDGSGRQVLMPFAVLCMWLALAPLGWRLLKPDTKITITQAPLAGR